MYLVTNVFILLSVLSWLLYRYLIQVYDYWKKRNVPGPAPAFPLGNMAEVAQRKKSYGEVVTSLYNAYPGEKFIGLFQGRSPVIIIRDLASIKQVLIKDFSNFQNRGLRLSDEPMIEHLFDAEDERWKLLRQRLTPIFTSGKLKGMFHLMDECIDDFYTYLEQIVHEDAEPEIRELMAKFTLELFGSCVYGINMRTMNDENNVFRYIGKQMFKPSLKTSLCHSFDSIFPGIIRKLNISQIDPEISGFFMNLVKRLIEEREGKPKVRNDFMDLILELKEEGHIAGDNFELEITDALMAAQAIIFYAAGFETSSGSMAFLLYELALNQDVQDRTYQEVKTIAEKFNGKLTYEALQEMTYLDMVMSETLRKYPVVGSLKRESANEYTFPGTKLTIDKKVKVLIPVYGLHHDPQYFPNPDKFDPERFSPQNKDNIEPCSYMPFGEGPRHCIGLRFAKVQAMVGVASLILKYKVVPSARTKTKLVFDPKSHTLQSLDGIWMKIQKR